MSNVVDHTDDITILSLCTGGGGLDLGVELALPGARVVCGVEWDAFAVEYLAALMEAQCVAPFHVWSNLKTFDGAAWRGCVDIVTAGYPCQPFSLAGNRSGADDPRHLWPDVARVIREAEPAVVFLENVAGHLSLGGREVIQELQGMGFRTAGGLFTASEVSAPHKRERLFILGLADNDEGRGGAGWRSQSTERVGANHFRNGDLLANSTQRGQRECGESSGGSGFADGCDETLDDAADRRSTVEESRSESRRRSGEVADPRCERPQGHEQAGRSARATGRSGGAEVGDADGAERWSDRRANGAGTRGGGIGPGTPCIPLFPPGPADLDRWREVLETDSSLEPAICDVADGLAAPGLRRNWLRLLGNGVCPLQAAYAFCSLWADLHEAGQ